MTSYQERKKILFCLEITSVFYLLGNPSDTSNLVKCGIYPFVQAYCMGINLIFLRDIKVNGPEEVLLKYLSFFLL